MLCSLIKPHLVRRSVAGLHARIMAKGAHLKLEEGRFYSHQESLPHLPVPPLKQTLDKYLKTVRPLLNEKQFEYTKSLVESFGAADGYGEHLQQKLLEHAHTKENWLSDWWLDCAYLESRASVVIYCSPSVSFPKYNFKGTEGQIEQAAKVIAAVLKYKVDIDNETLPIDKLGKSPLCMDQYYKILSSCRIPGICKDDAQCYARSWRPPRHITVIHNNHFFELDVYNDDKTPLSISQLETQLNKIVAASPEPSEVPLGILTSRNRDDWGVAYQLLSQNNENCQNLKSIHQSIFALCLDQDTPPVSEENWRSNWGGRCLHGGGSRWNSGNRWFDKTIQMIVGKDGGVGLIYEHSPAEGPPIAALMDHIYDYCENVSVEKDFSSVPMPAPKHLRFTVPNEINEHVKQGEQELDNLIARLNLSTFNFDDFGKDFIKSQKLSPDSFIQIALQLAYFRLHRKPPATYESASLRRFRLGRTDTIRSCSIISNMFTEAMVAKEKSVNELAQMLRDAVIDHKQYTNDAVSGNGIDRHLLGLRLVAKKSGQNDPRIFQDEAYKQAMSFNLSTSQVPCRADLSMAFGPAVDDGYGVCYNPKGDRILFSISSWKANPDYAVEGYCKELVAALQDMKSLLLSGKSKL